MALKLEKRGALLHRHKFGLVAKTSDFLRLHAGAQNLVYNLKA